eukprot:contig_21213_g5209
MVTVAYAAWFSRKLVNKEDENSPYTTVGARVVSGQTPRPGTSGYLGTPPKPGASDSGVGATTDGPVDDKLAAALDTSAQTLYDPPAVDPALDTSVETLYEPLADGTNSGPTGLAATASARARVG